MWEGAELQVLEGAVTTLQRHRPIVIFEHGSGSAETYGTLPADVFGLLERPGRVPDLRSRWGRPVHTGGVRAHFLRR